MPMERPTEATGDWRVVPEPQKGSRVERWFGFVLVVAYRLPSYRPIRVARHGRACPRVLPELHPGQPGSYDVLVLWCPTAEAYSIAEIRAH